MTGRELGGKMLDRREYQFDTRQRLYLGERERRGKGMLTLLTGVVCYGDDTRGQLEGRAWLHRSE